MKKIFYMSLLSLLSCNSDEKYLTKNDVLLCSTNMDKSILLPIIIEKEKKYKISIKNASDIYTKLLFDRKEIDNLNLDKIIYPNIIINDNYVYSFFNEKTGETAVFGVWIDCNNGNVKNSKDKIWLNEKDIINSMKEKGILKD